MMYVCVQSKHSIAELILSQVPNVCKIQAKVAFVLIECICMEIRQLDQRHILCGWLTN